MKLFFCSLWQLLLTFFSSSCSISSRNPFEKKKTRRCERGIKHLMSITTTPSFLLSAPAFVTKKTACGSVWVFPPTLSGWVFFPFGEFKSRGEKAEERKGFEAFFFVLTQSSIRAVGPHLGARWCCWSRESWHRRASERARAFFLKVERLDVY